MARRTLTAYGSQDDQNKLTALAKDAGLTSSGWIVAMIRREYERQFGNTPAETIVGKPE